MPQQKCFYVKSSGILNLKTQPHTHKKNTLIKRIKQKVKN